jgi:16S rRNA (guanine966-N2)-methyltransferase
LHVIAGSERGRRLRVPRGKRLRPTTGRAKEALFSALSARGRIVDARVLDLYAGTGALAIESLSRGARLAELVERDRDALAAISENLAATGFADAARVHARAVLPFLRGPTTPGAPFDLVFADPPYDLDPTEVAEVLRALEEGGWLATDAIVVVEHGNESAAGRALVVTWSRRFGDTLVTFLEAPELPGSG